METVKAIEDRKSIRSYLDKPVSDEVLKQLADLANRAPCAGAIHISIITDKNYLDEIDETTANNMLNSGVPFLVERASLPGYRPLYGAPALFVISADPGRGTANAAAAAATITYAATDLGLGSCYLGSILGALGGELGGKLELTEDVVPLAGVIVGYTDDPTKFSRDRQTPDNINFI